MTPRLEHAALFIARLHYLSRFSPRIWRRAASIGADVGLDGAALEQVLIDTEDASLIDRRVDDPGLVLLTKRGRRAARG